MPSVVRTVTATELLHWRQLILTAVIQVAGAALIGVSESARARGTDSPVTPKQANDILLAGLACQVPLQSDTVYLAIVADRQCFSFSTFLVVLCCAIYRSRKPGFPGPGISTLAYKQLRLMLWVILVTSDLILLRTVFRLAETGQGEPSLDVSFPGRVMADARRLLWLRIYPRVALCYPGVLAGDTRLDRLGVIPA